MPIYDYRCKECNKEFEELATIAQRNLVKSPCCDSSTMIVIKSGASYHRFPEGMFEHITENPIWVNDKPHLKQLCKEHGCHAVGLLD